MAGSDGERYAFVDSHLHLWDLASNRWYPALQEPLPEHDVGLGEMSKLRRNYLLSDYQADSAGYNVTKFVHVSATTSPKGFLAEIKWLDNLAGDSGFPSGCIGSIEPADDPATIEADLTAQAESPLFRGARVMYGADPESQSMRTLLSWLSESQFVFDLVIHPVEVPAFVTLLKDFPLLEVVVEHCGWPDRADDEHFAEWRKGLKALAALDNVNCKISGLPMTVHAMDADLLRPWIEACIQEWGVTRCLFGSNFPVDSLYGTFDELLASYRSITAALGPEEQKQLFVGNAERIYRI